MVDLNKIIPPMVGDIARLEPQFPNIAAKFPIVIFTPFDNGAEVILDGRERYTNAAFQLDIYDNGKTEEHAQDLAAALTERLTKRGFKRGNGAHIKENGLFRRTLYFTGVIDEKDKMIYRR